MTYRVLLVDDEYLDLLGLEQLVPWTSYGMEVVAAVKNGFEALQILQQQSVDLLVTDILMPNMTGLELAERARIDHPHLKIIFVSGYQDFQYARQALAMHANSYVLKPVDDEELFQQVHLVRTQLDQERERIRREALLRQSLPLAQEQVLHQWFEGALDTSSMRTVIGSHPLLTMGSPLLCALIEIDDVAWKLKMYSDEERADIVRTVTQIIYHFVDEQHNELCCKVADHKVAVLSSAHAVSFDRLIEQVQSETKLSVTIGLGEVISSLQMVPRAYQQAKKALASKMFFGKARCIPFQETRHELVQHASNLDQRFEALFTATASHDIQGIHNTLDDLFQYATQVRNKVSVYNFALHALSKLDAYLRARHEHPDILPGMTILDLDILYDFETIEDIKLWLRENMCQIAEYIYQKKQKRSHKVVLEIETYIAEHISSDFTLRDIAQHFGFSPNYLGYLFKEEKGETFTEYVNRKRLEQAVELLRDPKLKLYEIAYRLGYSNLTYFGRQFKETFGQTPGEFRRQL